MPTLNAAESRSAIVERIARHGVHATEQFISSLHESVLRTSPEIVGDTDTLLLGLLSSGSYTIDVLESASVDPRFLRELAIESAGYWNNRDLGDSDVDSIESLFASPTLRRVLASGKTNIETSDLLTASVSPLDRMTSFDLGAFPYEVELNKHKAPEPLASAIRELLPYLISTMYLGSGARQIRKMLTSRRHRIELFEDQALDRKLGHTYPDMTVEQLDFAISALNTWFETRTILTEPSALCLGLVSVCASLLYGPKHFADSGGDLKVLNSCLDLTRRFNPERDLNHMCLFNLNGQIHVGQYTYRNTLATTSRDKSHSELMAVSLEAIRPVPFLSPKTIVDFESLLSTPDVSENQIQRFLEINTGFFAAMGYVRAIPHVFLREDDKDEMIPDFILQLPGNRGFDILDLKLPRARLMSRNPYLRVSSEISKAIGQLKAYKDYFNVAENRRRFQMRYGLEAFRPEVCVVIGRNTCTGTNEDRKAIEELMGQTRLYTYDDLIAYGNSRLLPEAQSIRKR